MTLVDRARYLLITLVAALLLSTAAHAGESEPTDRSPSQETDITASAAQAEVMDKTITRISIVGGHNVNRSLIMDRLGIERGDQFDADVIERGLERLKALSGVKSTILRVLPDRESGGIELAIVISDEDTRIIRPSLSRALTNDWSFGVCFEDRNMRGMNEDLRGRLLLGGAAIVQASYLKPWFMQQPYVGGGVFASYTDYDYPYPDYGRLLVDKRIKRFEAGAEIRINILDFLHLSLRPGVDMIDVADTMSYVETVPSTPKGTFTTLEVLLSLDLLDRDFYPERGFSVAGGRKDWGIIQEDSEIKNFQYWAEGSGYYRLWKAIGVLHSRAEFTKGGNVPLILLSHLGGEGTIRGYDYGIFSGTNSVIANAELRFPMNFKSVDADGNPFVLVDFHVFIDSGACWSEPESFDTELFHSGFGCGFNVIPAKKGMLTVDYAWRMDTNGVWSVNAGFFF